jgi:alpha-beta hydrolase superfamily lysophospholipase
MINYLRSKFGIADKNEVIVLVHGLLRTKYSMYRLGRYLRRHGYIVYLYGYPSTKFNIVELSNHMQHFLNTFTEQHADKKIHFVTHSMGGIISREALRNFSDLPYFGSLVMLAPPNKGSPIAYSLLKRFPFLAQILKPLPQLSNDPFSFIHQVHIPTNIQIGVIAAKYDRKVPPELTHIAGEKDHITLRTNHTLIINSRKAKKAILNFISSGKF